MDEPETRTQSYNRWLDQLKEHLNMVADFKISSLLEVQLLKNIMQKNTAEWNRKSSNNNTDDSQDDHRIMSKYVLENFIEEDFLNDVELKARYFNRRDEDYDSFLLACASMSDNVPLFLVRFHNYTVWYALNKLTDSVFEYNEFETDTKFNELEEIILYILTRGMHEFPNIFSYYWSGIARNVTESLESKIQPLLTELLVKMVVSTKEDNKNLVLRDGCKHAAYYLSLRVEQGELSFKPVPDMPEHIGILLEGLYDFQDDATVFKFVSGLAQRLCEKQTTVDLPFAACVARKPTKEVKLISNYAPVPVQAPAQAPALHSTKPTQFALISDMIPFSIIPDKSLLKSPVELDEFVCFGGLKSNILGTLEADNLGENGKRIHLKAKCYLFPQIKVPILRFADLLQGSSKQVDSNAQISVSNLSNHPYKLFIAKDRIFMQYRSCKKQVNCGKEEDETSTGRIEEFMLFCKLNYSLRRPRLLDHYSRFVVKSHIGSHKGLPGECYATMRQYTVEEPLGFSCVQAVECVLEPSKYGFVFTDRNVGIHDAVKKSLLAVNQLFKQINVAGSIKVEESLLDIAESCQISTKGLNLSITSANAIEPDFRDNSIPSMVTKIFKRFKNKLTHSDWIMYIEEALQYAMTLRNHTSYEDAKIWWTPAEIIGVPQIELKYFYPFGIPVDIIYKETGPKTLTFIGLVDYIDETNPRAVLRSTEFGKCYEVPIDYIDTKMIETSTLSRSSRDEESINSNDPPEKLKRAVLQIPKSTKPSYAYTCLENSITCYVKAFARENTNALASKGSQMKKVQSKSEIQMQKTNSHLALRLMKAQQTNGDAKTSASKSKSECGSEISKSGDSNTDKPSVPSEEKLTNLSLDDLYETIDLLSSKTGNLSYTVRPVDSSE